MLASIRKWFAVRSFAKELGPKLRERYGAQSKYTPTQVVQTIREGRFNVDYECFALSMFCDRLAFDDYHRFFGRACDYDSMRSELADRFFDGDASFEIADIIRDGVNWDSTNDENWDASDSHDCSAGHSDGDSND